MQEIDNSVTEEIVENQQNETPKKRVYFELFDKKKHIFDIVYLAIISIFVLVMLCGGFNILPLVTVVLGMFSGLIIFLRILNNRSVGVFLFSAYACTILGTFLYFLIWGAENFGKTLWWNIVLILAPVAFSALLVCSRYFKLNFKSRKIFNAIVVLLMTFSALIYFMFMSLRTRPTVERLWKGQTDYLDTLKNRSVSSAAPNVVVVLMDDLGYGDISAYSYLNSLSADGTAFDSTKATIQTPNIDSLADGGIMMDNFYSSSSVCSPSRFSLLTGRYSSRGYLDNVVFPSVTDSNPWSPTHFLNPSQFKKNVDGILGDEITFAEALQSSGYRTGCIGKWNLGDYGEYLPTNQGFDYFYGSHYVNDMTPYNWVEEEKGVFREVRTHSQNLDQSESTALLTSKLNEFISTSIDNNEKFLAYYATPWPHYPIYSNQNGNGNGDTTDDTYIACIEEFDRYLGDMISLLKEKGVYDDTLIVFSSDNGPGREGATGALRGRKNTTFEGGMKVPLIASYPNGGIGSGNSVPQTTITTLNGQISTKRIESSSMMFDLFATILSYAGIDVLPSDRIIDGKDLKNLWNCNVAADYRIHDTLYYQKRGQAQGIQMALELDGTVFDFKYYDSVATENAAFFNQVYKNYLFNLDLDPIEAYSISKEHPSIAAAMHNQLELFRKEMKTNRRGIIKTAK